MSTRSREVIRSFRASPPSAASTAQSLPLPCAQTSRAQHDGVLGSRQSQGDLTSGTFALVEARARYNHPPPSISVMARRGVNTAALLLSSLTFTFVPVDGHPLCYLDDTAPSLDITSTFCANEEPDGFCCAADVETGIQLEVEGSGTTGVCAELFKEVPYKFVRYRCACCFVISVVRVVRRSLVCVRWMENLRRAKSFGRDIRTRVLVFTACGTR